MNIIDTAKKTIDIEISALEYLKENLDKNFEAAIEEILKSNGQLVVTGMGKSGLVGRKISATLASTGTRSIFLHPAEAYHGDLGMISPEDVVLAISNSGETQEVLKLLSFFKDNGNKVIAMAKSSESTLAKYSDYFLNIGVQKEACPLELAPTSSTTATMVMGDALAVSLMHKRNFKAENFARFHPGGSLGRKLLSKVKDFMLEENLPVVTKDEKFSIVLEKISKGRLGIAIVEDNKKVIGVVTDGDVRRALAKYEGDALKKKANEIMTQKPLSCEKNLKLAEAERILHDKKVTNLLVLEDETLVGILNRYHI